MKNNRKNRKLYFIREKNAYRLGRKRFDGFFKIAKVFQYSVKLGDFVKIEIAKLQIQLYEKYKIILNSRVITVGFVGDDFINDRITFKITLFNRRS